MYKLVLTFEIGKNYCKNNDNNWRKKYRTKTKIPKPVSTPEKIAKPRVMPRQIACLPAQN